MELVFDIDDLRQAVIADRIARDAMVVYVEAARVLLLGARSTIPFDPPLELRILALGTQLELIGRELGPTAVHTLIRYITSALPPGSPVRDRILSVISQETRTMYLSVYDEMRAEGRAEGRLEGRLEGKLEGKIEALLKLLTHHGLSLDEPLRARVLACTDETQVGRWFDRALAATTLADVFAEP